MVITIIIIETNIRNIVFNHYRWHFDYWKLAFFCNLVFCILIIVLLVSKLWAIPNNMTRLMAPITYFYM